MTFHFFIFFFFFFNDTATTEIYTLSLHDALPILVGTTSEVGRCVANTGMMPAARNRATTSRAALANSPLRSEEHTSELQSQSNLVCRLLLEKKKKKYHRPLMRSSHLHSHTYTAAV